MTTAERADILAHTFTLLDAAFTRHNVQAFIHLRRRMEGLVELRFHTPWPAPAPLSTELDRIADEAALHFVPSHVEGAGLVVLVEPLPQLEDLM